MPSLLLREVGPPIPLPLTSVSLRTDSILAHSSSALLSSLDICPVAALLVVLAPQQQTRGGKTRSKNTHNHLRDTKEHAKSFKKKHLSTTTTQKEVP